MERLESWRYLKVWEKSHLLTLKVYNVTGGYPRSEQYALTSQIRRASYSVASNIVEATKRKSNKDQRRFYIMSDSSLEEVKYFLILSFHLKYIDQKVAKQLTKSCREIGRMLSGLIKKNS